MQIGKRCVCVVFLLRPVANFLSALHGVPCVADVIWLERHHGLHLQQGGVDESVVHALARSARRVTSVSHWSENHSVQTAGKSDLT